MDRFSFYDEDIPCICTFSRISNICINEKRIFYLLNIFGLDFLLDLFHFYIGHYLLTLIQKKILFSTYLKNLRSYLIKILLQILFTIIFGIFRQHIYRGVFLPLLAQFTTFMKIKSKDDKFYILLFGIWIGLSFMMKTFLVLVPLVSLVPYLFTKKNILFSKFFWLGLLLGFIPYLFWTLSINPYLEKNIIFYLIEKFNILSNKNSFTNPFYYYLWNNPDCKRNDVNK